MKETARRSFVAKRDIKKGEKITLEMLDFKRPGDAGISCVQLEKVVDKKAVKNITKDEFLQWDMLESKLWE